jgi:hypothetical protein
MVFALISQLDPGRLASHSNSVHLANEICGPDDLYQNGVLSGFLRPVVVFEDVNEFGREVPTAPNAFADQTVIDSKLFLLRFHRLPPENRAGDNLGFLRAQGKYEKRKDPHIVQES